MPRALGLNDTGGGHRSCFLFAVDPTADLAVTKYREIQRHLKDAFNYEIRVLAPEEVTFKERPVFLPTTRFVGFLIESGDRDAIEKVLKTALYRPAEDRKDKKDHFNLRAHGLLI